MPHWLVKEVVRIVMKVDVKVVVKVGGEGVCLPGSLDPSPPISYHVTMHADTFIWCRGNLLL